MFFKIRQQIAAERKFYFMGALRNVKMHSLLDHLTCRQNSFQLKERKDCGMLRSIDGPNRKPEKSSLCDFILTSERMTRSLQKAAIYVYENDSFLQVVFVPPGAD